MKKIYNWTLQQTGSDFKKILFREKIVKE